MSRDNIDQFIRIVHLVRSAPSQSAIILTDGGNNVILWSFGAEKLLGYRAEEVLGGGCPFEYRPTAQKSQKMSDPGHPETETEADSYTYRTSTVTRDGRRLLVHVSASRLMESGKAAGHLYVLEDVTEDVIQEKLRLILVSIAQIASKKQPLIKMVERCVRAIQTHLELPLVYLCFSTREGFSSSSWSGIRSEPLSLHCSAESSGKDGISVKCAECRSTGQITCEELASHHCSAYIGGVNDYNEPLYIFHAPLTSDSHTLGILHFVIPESLKRVYTEEGQILDLIAHKVTASILTRQLEENLKEYADNLERIVKKRTDELREKDAQIIQSAKMATLGEMATGVAHEINQPLGGISLITQGLLRALHKGKLTPAILEDRLNAINEQIERINKIITHLRTFGRQTPESRSRVQVNKCILDVFDFIGQQLRNHNIRLDVDLDDKLSDVMADNNRLEQVLLNMLTNARDALEDQEKRVQRLLSSRHPPKWAVDWEKKIFIRTYDDANHVVIAIGDTGGGIPDKIREKIFEPFFTTKEVNRGTGLGLSISYGIIRDYGGDISLVTQVDRGSTFFIKLPAVEA